MKLKPCIILILLFIFSYSCKEGSKEGSDAIDNNTSLSEKYILTNSIGDTIETGTPIRVQGKRIDPDSVEKPRTLPLDLTSETVPAHANTYPAGQPKIVPVPKELTVITPGRNGVPLPITYPAHGKIVPALQPKPIPALGPEMNNDARYDIQCLDVDQRMRSNEVFTSIEDSRGRLWFATQEGATCYDGTSFTHYGEKEGLSPNGVFSIMEDSRGNLWFGSWEGLAVRYDGTHFTHFKARENKFNRIVTIAEDSHGHIWFNSDGAVRYNPDDGPEGSFTYFNNKDFFGDDVNVLSILEDKQGRVWFGTGGAGLYRYDPHEGESGSFTRFTENEGLTSNFIGPYTLMEDRQGYIWIGIEGGGVSRYDPEDGPNGSFAHFNSDIGLNSEFFSTILEDKVGHIWIASAGRGLYRFDPLEGKHGSFTLFTVKEGLPSNKIWSIMEDHNGKLWISTSGGGVCRYDPKSFVSFAGNEGLRDHDIKSIVEDDNNNLWFGIQGKVIAARYDGKNFTNFGGDNLPHTRYIQKDSRGNLWVGHAGGGVTRIGLNKGKFRGTYTNFSQKEGLSWRYLWHILEDSRGNMWFATGGGGINRFEPDKVGTGGVFTHFEEKEGLSNGVIQSIMEDHHGNIWFGTWNGGVSRLDGEHITHFTINEGLGHNWVWPMFEDSRNQIWFGTRAPGVSQLVPASNGNDKITHFSKQDGFNDNQHIYSILEDNDKNIWVSTNKGIGVFVPSPEGTSPVSDFDIPGYRYFSFEKADGCKFLNFNRHSVCLDSKNRMWWGSSIGAIMLDLNQFELPSEPPGNIQLSHIEVNQQFVDYRRLADTSYSNSVAIGKDLKTAVNSVVPFQNYPTKLSLPYDINHLTFHLSAIDWEAPEKIRYSYMVDGLDTDWSIPQLDPKVEYRHLPHGNFTLKVKAIGEAQVWSEPFEYTFAILPPWWHTWWAYMLYAIAVLAALGVLIRWRTRVQRLKLAKANRLNDRLQQVDLLKDQFLANTSHELRTPLHGIIGIAESVFDEVKEEDQKENLGMIIASGKRLSSLVNDLLDFSKVKNHELHLSQKAIGLRAIGDIVLQACQALIGTKPVFLHNEIPEDLPLVFADENRLQQIFYNLVGNAIKFTDQGNVTLRANVKEIVDSSSTLKQVVITVEDTGIGIPKEKQASIFQAFEQGNGTTARTFGGTGLGLAITRQLVELHGGEIGVESDSGEGSSFFFSLPIADEKTMTQLNETVKKTPVTKSLFAGLSTANRSSLDLLHGEILPPPVVFEGTSRDIHLLLVDDEPLNHQVIKNYLKGSHIHIHSAMNGQEALDVVSKGAQYDLVLLDVMMPRMSGYEVCQKIREQYLPSEMPVIMLTAKSQIADLIQGLETGANDYITKPFSKDEFLARIKTHLNLHRIHSATNKFVPSDFLKTIGRNNITEVQLGDQKEQNITVLFTDIRSYTGLAETMTPDENFRFVNAYAGRMGPIIRENNGFVNQYLGDGIMALFQHQPEDALKAAIGMQRELHSYNQQREKQGRLPIKVGMGLHTGSLIMGIIGDELRNNPATISDTVNTASRMEGLTKYFGSQILISESVYNTLPSTSLYHLRYLGLVQVKGKHQALQIYECLNGLPEEILSKMLTTLSTFEEGMQHYFSKNFDQAAVVFKQVLALNPEDKAAQLYLARCASYMVVGVPPEWAGIEMMEQK